MFIVFQISRDTNQLHTCWQAGAVAVAETDFHMGECRILRPVTSTRLCSSTVNLNSGVYEPICSIC
jgi:hypothetical protein